MNENNEGYQNINLEALQGNFKNLTNALYVENPAELDLGQIPTLQKMIDKLQFEIIEKEGELDVLKSQIMAINSAVIAMMNVQAELEAKNKNPKEEQPEN